MNHLLNIAKQLFPAVLLLGTACGKTEPDPTPVHDAACRFTLALDEPGGPDTRSLLVSADIEQKITSVTLGVYQGGLLAEKAHFDTGFDQMSFPLEDGVYTAYALVNMGDMSGQLPDRESALPDLCYNIPGYTEPGTGIEYRGIPMAGKLDYTVGVTGNGTIPVRRLLAKVTAVLSCGWSGVITSVKVCQLNGTLKPFGTSAAASQADILPIQEFSAGGDAASGSFVFYVPENLQGTFSGITDSHGKSPEGSSGVNGKKALLTYLETEVKGISGVEGTIVYRSFLGADATSNFDIRRNCRYTWTLRFLPDGRLYNDWKHENRLKWSEYRYAMEPSSLVLYPGESAFVTVQRHEDRYVNGVFHADGGPVRPWASYFNWSYYPPGNPSFTNDNSVIVGALNGNNYSIYANGPGSRRITATGEENSYSCDVLVRDYSRKLILVADRPRARVGELVYLRALLFTTQNGVTSTGEDVTADQSRTFLYREESESLNPVKMVSNGVLSAQSAGEDRFSARYNCTEDDHFLGAFGVWVTFEDQLTGNLTINGAGAVGTTGGGIQLSASFTPYSGGVPGSPVDVSSSVQWRIQDGDNVVHIQDGYVTSSQATAAVAHASYSVGGITYRAHAVVRFNR